MISDRILYQLVKTVLENKKIEGIKQLSELSGVPEITIKVNIHDIEGHPNINHSRIGARRTHVFEYQGKSNKKSLEFKNIISNYTKIVKQADYWIEDHLKKMKKLKLHESQISGSAEFVAELFIDIDKISERLTSLKLKTKKRSSTYETLEDSNTKLSKLKLKLHSHVYAADPLIESRMMIILGSARVDKKFLRRSTYQ
jgi:hypothetical protein